MKLVERLDEKAKWINVFLEVEPGFLFVTPVGYSSEAKESILGGMNQLDARAELTDLVKRDIVEWFSQNLEFNP